MIRETVCELADLNFFFDLLQIEHARTGDDPHDIRDRMAPVSAGQPFTSCPKIPRSSLFDQAMWLFALRNFVANWPLRKEFGFYVEVRYRPASWTIRTLESSVAEVYCLCVRALLYRSPVLPRY
jgi:hypothetical protein